MHARLASDTDLAGFRTHARALFAQGVAPDAVHWSVGADDNDLFTTEPSSLSPSLSRPPAVPREFALLCEEVVLHRDPQRFALLYRLLWRLVHEPGLRGDPLDPDVMLAQRMAHSVRRDMHKMRAFVRFRPVPDADCAAGVRHVAWFEPEHHIVEANGPWFVRRFTQMHWAILTPDRCAEWDGTGLHFGEGATRAQAPGPDAGEALWLTYYRSIFNPARLKLAAMRKEMPRRYWKNLPEATLISPLSAQAARRSSDMLERPAQAPRRRIPLQPVPAAEHAAVGTLAALHDAAQSCRNCPIGAHATQAVAGEGPVAAALMIVGEQPGDQEDLAGRPFVGPAGRLLDRAMAQAGIARESAFLTNAVRHFGFELRGKRRIHKTPSRSQAAACAHWLEAEIAFTQPGALVALGATAARSLLGRDIPVTRRRGEWHPRADGRMVLVTLHPSALLRMPPHAQESAFDDFVADLRVAAAGPPRMA